MSPRAAEATAPARVDLSGGILDIWPVYLFHPGAAAVQVAINRRPWARVEVGGTGVVVESKDRPDRVEGRDVAEVLASGREPLVAHLLRALGAETGLRVTTQARVPAGSGLGGSSALAVALAAAAARALGLELSHGALAVLARDAETQALGVPTGILDYETALRGGVIGARLEAGQATAERLATDPARVEECLLLVDPGVSGPCGVASWGVVKAQIDGDAAVRGALATISKAAAGVRDALLGERYGDVGPLLAQEEAARGALRPEAPVPEVDRILGLVRSNGGAAQVCGGGAAGVVAAWAVPGARQDGVRERVDGVLRAAGCPPLSFRVDLRGLEVEG